MARIQEIYEIVDKATAPLRNIEAAMGSVVNQTVNINIQIDEYNKRQKQTEETTERTKEKVNGLSVALGKLAAAFLSARVASAALKLSDELSLAHTRLNNINDGLQTTAELQELIYQSAQRSRGSYIGMMQTVASLKAKTGDTFASVKEAVAFTELLNKQFKIAGADATAISSTMYNLTQALSTGVLRGQDLNIVMSNAPQIAQRIAKAMGVSVGELKELASQGKVTSDVVKNAILGSADDINKQFEQMPMTFGDAMQKLKNMGVRAFQPMGQLIADSINSSGVESAINGIGQGLYIVSSIFGQLLTFMVNGFSVIGNALGFVTSGFGGMGQVAVAVVGTIVGLFVALEATVVNIVLLIADIFITASEGIANGWSTMVYTIQNAVIGFASGAISAFRSVVSAAASAANAIANAFVQGANIAIGGINKLIDAINKIPGVNIGSVGTLAAPGNVAADMMESLDGVSAALEAMRPDAPEMKQFTHPDYFDIPATFQNGKNIGSEWMSGILEGAKQQTETGGMGDLGVGGNKSLENLMPNGGNVGSVGKVKKVDNVKLSDEDLKIYRDLAERRYMNNIELKTLAPEITVNLPAGASGNISAQDVADKLKRMLIAEMAAQTSVAHA